jgi:adenine phosphoribosyltransferase
MESPVLETLYGLVRDVPDFPKPGILFRDITPILLDPEALDEAIERLIGPFRTSGVTKVVAVESRGFVLGAPAALALRAGLVLVRKPGKLPAATRRAEYRLEYGTDALEMHRDALEPADRVLIVDDVLATGGTAAATAGLVEQAGARIVGLAFLIELADLGGRARASEGRSVHSVLTFPRR